MQQIVAAFWRALSATSTWWASCSTRLRDYSATVYISILLPRAGAISSDRKAVKASVILATVASVACFGVVKSASRSAAALFEIDRLIALNDVDQALPNGPVWSDRIAP